VFKSIDGGVDWSVADTGLTNRDITALAIDPAAPQTIYAATQADGVFKTIDGGDSWNAVDTGLPPPRPSVHALAVDPATPQTLYAGTTKGVYKSINGGDDWDSSGLTGYIYALAIDPMTPQTLYAGEYYSKGVYESINGGAGWTAINNGLTNTRIGVLAIDPTMSQILYAGTRGGGVFKFGQEASAPPSFVFLPILFSSDS
jgi:hypothetical protein